MSPRLLSLAAPVLAAVLALAACSGSRQPAPAGGPVPVVTTTDVYASVVRAVGGERVAVTAVITDPGADPHSYEASPAAAAAVARARLVVVNGGGYDDFAGRLVAASGTQPVTVDVVALSGLTGNEHVWYSLPTMKKLATAVAADLAAADPAGAPAFEAGAASFGKRVDEVAARVDAIRAAHAGERVAVTEPVPEYLVEAAGLRNVTPPEFSEAVEEDADPPAAAVAAILDLFRAEPVRALLLNAQTRTPATDQVEQAARAAGVPVVEVGETLPAGVDDYAAWMQGQVETLAAALDRR
jgi:zinc/manganese transport system substrate-binding protein